jgi:hypothetical protein
MVSQMAWRSMANQPSSHRCQPAQGSSALAGAIALSGASNAFSRVLKTNPASIASRRMAASCGSWQRAGAGATTALFDFWIAGMA